MRTPEWMRETHFRFLEAAEALTNSNPAGKPFSLHTVCSQAGINDENDCLSTMNDLLRTPIFEKPLAPTKLACSRLRRWAALCSSTGVRDASLRAGVRILSNLHNHSRCG